MVDQTVVEAIRSKHVVDENGCHIWTGGMSRGTPILEYIRSGKRSRVFPHRVLWALSHGDAGRRHVERTCSNAKCVNIAHMEAPGLLPDAVKKARRSEQNKRYKKANSARYRAREKERWLALPEEVKAERRERLRAYVKAHGKEYAAKAKKRNARRFFFRRAKVLFRRGHRPSLAPLQMARELASIWKRQRGRCALSGRKLKRDAHLDHIIPVSRGGSSEPSNLRWVCPEANQAKHNMTDEEFIRLCLQVARTVGSIRIARDIGTQQLLL